MTKELLIERINALEEKHEQAKNSVVHHREKGEDAAAERSYQFQKKFECELYRLYHELFKEEI